MKVYEFVVILLLIVAIATVAVILQTRHQRVYLRMERICLGAGFDGITSERGRAMYCYRVREDGTYETVIVNVVMYYTEGGER